MKNPSNSPAICTSNTDYKSTKEEQAGSPPLSTKRAYMMDEHTHTELKMLVRDKHHQAPWYESNRWIDIMEQLDEAEAYIMQQEELNH